MAILAIETSSRQLGVAAFDGARILSSYEVLGDFPHAVELPGAVSRVLAEARTALKALEGIVVDIGPGSFTGLRIGLAFVKALLLAHKIPLVAVASLDVLAAQLAFAPHPVYAILDARQGNVYMARYRLTQQEPIRDSDYLLGRLDDVLASSPEPAFFTGDGAGVFRDAILARVPHAVTASPEFWLPKAGTLARLGWTCLQQGQREDPAKVVPLYLYPMDCSVRAPDRPTSVIPKPVAAV